MNSDKFQADFVAMIFGIIMVVFGIIALFHPLTTYVTLAVLVGITAIVRGIVLISNFIKERRCTGGNTANCIFGLVIAVISIILGIYLLFNPGLAMLTLGYIVALWVIFDAINNLFSIRIIRELKPGLWVFELILNILLLIGGVMLFFDPISSGFAASIVIAILLIVSGIMTFISGIYKPRMD